MPRLDRSYTSDDLIRIYLLFLTQEEQVQVEEFFQGEPFEVLDSLLDLLLDFFGLIPVVGELAEAIGAIIDITEFLDDLQVLQRRLETLNRLRRR